MGYPRYIQVPPDTAGTYHCVSRCVRRAYLCGDDEVTGRSFEHRKEWLEARVIELAGVFAIAVHAYAIMSNHFHVIVQTDPDAPRRWSDVEVARRWLALSDGGKHAAQPLESRVGALTGNPERLEELRARLGSLSWFMRYLKEPIARRANQEDACTGRFWEGRFKTQSLLDDPAVLAAMVYVDLNPLRAGVVAHPEAGPHTSLRRRIHSRPGRGDLLQPVAASIRSELVDVTVEQYLELVQWTARELHPAKPGSDVPRAMPPVVARLGLRREQWLARVPATESRYWRVIGGIDALREHARRTGRRWVRGIGVARAIEGLSQPG